jgi:hypothetical protein
MKAPEGVDPKDYTRKFTYKWLHPMFVAGFVSENGDTDKKTDGGAEDQENRPNTEGGTANPIW